MVAYAAFLDGGQIIVLVVYENSLRPLRICKNLVVNDSHIFL